MKEALMVSNKRLKKNPHLSKGEKRTHTMVDNVNPEVPLAEILTMNHRK